MTDVTLGSTSFKDTKVTSKSELSLKNKGKVPLRRSLDHTRAPHCWSNSHHFD